MNNDLIVSGGMIEPPDPNRNKNKNHLWFIVSILVSLLIGVLAMRLFMGLVK